MGAVPRPVQTVAARRLMVLRLRERSRPRSRVSRVVFDESARIREQVDYWDASPLLAAFPVLGRVIPLIRRLAS